MATQSTKSWAITRSQKLSVGTTTTTTTITTTTTTTTKLVWTTQNTDISTFIWQAFDAI